MGVAESRDSGAHPQVDQGEFVRAAVTLPRADVGGFQVTVREA